ncbi:MAG: hypothetical protein PF439_01075, partial [Helicobacteraceae bacterium]|nr:hypothetical protein [Helicobacteraceae bacterium]
MSKFESQMFFSTIRITIPNEDGITSSVGTGFLFSIPLRQEGKSGIFLVSNKHVYGDPSKTIILNFHKRKDDIDEPDLGSIKP